MRNDCEIWFRWCNLFHLCSISCYTSEHFQTTNEPFFVSNMRKRFLFSLDNFIALLRKVIEFRERITGL